MGRLPRRRSVGRNGSWASPSFFCRPSLTTDRTYEVLDRPGNQQGAQGCRSPSSLPGQAARKIQAALAKRHPQAQGTHEEVPRQASPAVCRKAPAAFALRASDKAVERHSARRASPSSRATGRKPPAPVAAPGGAAPTRNRRRHGFSTVRARAFPRNCGGSARASGESTSAKTAAVGAGTRKTPPPLRKGLARSAPCASCLLRAASLGSFARRATSEL